MNNDGEFLWIQLPDATNLSAGSFKLDSKIPLPLEKGNSEENLNADEISWDKVVSAILLLLSLNPKHLNADYYRKLTLVLKPDIIENLKTASASSLGDDDYTRAEHILLALLGLAPNDSSVQYNAALFYDQKANHLRKLNHDDEAADSEQSAVLAYENLLSRDEIKDNLPPMAWFHAGRFYYRIHSYRKAAEKLQYFLTICGDKEARMESERLLAICRKGGQAYEEAYQLINKGEIQEGHEKAKAFYKLNQKSWPAAFLLGWSLRLLGNWEAARKILIEAREKGCDEGELFNEIALCSREMGNYQEAEKMFHEALQKTPDNIKIISNLGIICLDQGKTDEARRWFQIAFTLEPNDPVCLQFLNEPVKNTD